MAKLYDVIVSANRVDLLARVNTAIVENGWELQGGVAIDYDRGSVWYAQAIVKEIGDGQTKSNV